MLSALILSAALCGQVDYVIVAPPPVIVRRYDYVVAPLYRSVLIRRTVAPLVFPRRVYVAPPVIRYVAPPVYYDLWPTYVPSVYLGCPTCR